MAKKNEAVSYTYDAIRKKYVTTDGIAYDTMEQASAHCKEVNNKNQVTNERHQI